MANICPKCNIIMVEAKLDLTTQVHFVYIKRQVKKKASLESTRMN